MLLILAYIPCLICLPLLLLVGTIVVLVPGGFIVVIVGVYYLSLGFAGLASMIVGWCLRAARAKPELEDAGRAPKGASRTVVAERAGSQLIAPQKAAATTAAVQLAAARR